MRSLFTILFLSLFFSAFSQTGTFDYLTANRRFTLAGRTVKGISNDTMMLIASADSLVTQYAVKGYINNNFGPGTSNAYNFNPEQFIVSGYDVSIRFPQDPGEPLFAGSPSFNFTQQHLNFLDSLMLAVGEDTYLDDRDFYYSQDTLNPIRWKAFTLTTDGTGAASWDSINKNLNIPVSVSGPGGGSTGVYHLPYNGDSTSYLGGDSALHQLPPTPPPGDSIDYSFTSMTTIYNEAGPGEYTISSSDVTVNKDNLQYPFRQLKSLDVGGWNAGSYVSFANTGSANSTAYTFLRGFVRLKQAVPIVQSLSFRFYKSGSPVSQILSMVNYGLDKSKINSYQNITIPMSAFQFTSNDFDEIRLIFGGGSSADGLYLDLFQFQNATAQENVYVTDVFKQPGTDSIYKVLGGQNVFAFKDSAGIATDTTPLHNQLIQQLAAIQNNTASILLKLNISDTAAMLSPYLKSVDTTNKWLSKSTPFVSSFNGRIGAVMPQSGDYNTDNVTEATNKYYTDTRARAAITLTTSGTSGAASYDNSTGVINIPNYTNSTPTLQQVTDVGATTTNPISVGAITVTNSTGVLGSISRIAGTTTGGGALKLKDPNSTFSTQISPNTLASDGFLRFPNSPSSEVRTLVTSVNGIVADADGNVTTSTGSTGGAGTVGTITWLGTTYNINSANNITLPTPTTTDISEGTNLYYTDTRARAAITLTTTGTSGAATYNTATGALNIPSYANSAGWSLSGNTYSAGNFLGLTSNNSLRIYTNSTQRMVIDSLGFVGINGNPDAAKRLSVNGSISAGTDASSVSYWVPSGGAIRGTGTGTGTNWYIDGNVNGAQGTITMRATVVTMPSVSAGGTLNLTNGSLGLQLYSNNVLQLKSDSSHLYFNDNTKARKVIYRADGNLFSDNNTNAALLGDPDASAVMEVRSTTKGLLPPRMTKAQIDAIASPAEGLEIYNLTTHQKNYYNGTTWIAY